MERRENGAFCRAYLRTMDPERAAAEIAALCGFESPNTFYRAYARYADDEQPSE